MMSCIFGPVGPKIPIEERTVDLFRGQFIILDCPNCGYGADVELMSAHLQREIFCPCCKITIKMIDPDASAYAAQKDIDGAIDDLQREFTKIGKSITFKL